jgi:glutamate racemase
MKIQNQKKPIGIFDSGVGGLTVAAAVHKLLPHEDIVYLGDTARLPYGNKSFETIVQYARQCGDFLRHQNVKIVIVACNTATAMALPTLQRELELPVVGVIQPGVEAALQNTRSGRVGLIGTIGTIRSGAYQKALQAAGGNKVRVTARATPLLVPLIEEGWCAHPSTRLILREYLKPLKKQRIDTLILGCTHYPLLKSQIAAEAGPGVRLVDSASNLARMLRRVLTEKNLQNPQAVREGRVDVYVSDLTAQFQGLVRRIMGKKANSIRVVHWG